MHTAHTQHTHTEHTQHAHICTHTYTNAVFLKVVHVDPGATNPEWNTLRGENTTDIKGALNLIQAYKNAHSGGYPMWHLLTDNFGPYGTVGLAFVGVLCRGTGVTTRTGGGPSTWTTVKCSTRMHTNAHKRTHNTHLCPLRWPTKSGTISTADTRSSWGR